METQAMGEWRLDNVGRQFDGAAPPAPPASGEAPAAAPGGRPQPPGGRTKGSLGWLWLLLAAVVVGAASGFGIWYMLLAPAPMQSVEPVMINADRTPVRVAPEDPGGLDVPHRDRLVLQDRDDEGPPLEASARPQPERAVPVARAELPRAESDGGEAAGAERARPEPTVRSNTAIASEATGEGPTPTDPIADLIERTEAAAPAEAGAAGAQSASEGDAPAPTRSEAASRTAEPSAESAPTAPTAPGQAASVDPGREASLSETTDRPETADVAEGGAPPVEVLMPRLPGPDEAAEDAAGQAAADADDAGETMAASATAGPRDDGAAPAEVARGATAGPVTQHTLGRDPASLSAGGDDPFVDLLTALTWPSDRSYERAQAGANADGGIDTAGLAAAPLLEPAAGPPAIDAPDAADAPASPDRPVARDAVAQGFQPQADGGYRVQIVAVQAEPDAASEWQRYSATYPDLLGDFEPFVQQVDLGDRGVWYRVQAGPLDRAGADALCGALRERGADCIVRQR